MPRYVLVNRRAGKFTAEEKQASRSILSATLARLEGSAQVLADKNPRDDLARRVVMFEADADQVAKMQSALPSDAMIEPLIRRSLGIGRPVELFDALMMAATRDGAVSTYHVTVKGGNNPLPGTQVTFYVRDQNSQLRAAQAVTDRQGRAKIGLGAGQMVSFVQPFPNSGFWTMLAEAPPSGSTIECPPIKKAEGGGASWWHGVMGIDVADKKRGEGIKIGVMDTGCGPHPSLSHVKLVGVYVEGRSLPGDQAADVAQHGTHTTGIIGSRPAKSGDYAGIAPGCELMHARMFKSEEEGPTQVDVINAVDALSRDHGCDLINMSFGGKPPSEAEQDAIRDATERGTLCICSAGNSAGPIIHPAAYPECVAVAAVGQIGWAPAGTYAAGTRPKDSALHGRENLFFANFSCFGDTLTCAGPGVGIVSTVPAQDGAANAFMEMDGTSMASPAVCGALAVILSRDASYKSLPRDISRSNAARSLLERHCRSIGLAPKFEGRGLPYA
jgi:subtilisin